MNDCPNCELGHVKDGVCPRCEWVAPKVRGVDSRPDWSPPPFTPPTAEEAEALRGLIAETAAKLGAAAAPTRRTRELRGVQRCDKCITGNFVHMGVRYCLDGYLGRHA